MTRTLATLMSQCRSKSELSAALEPKPRKIYFSAMGADVLKVIEMILSLARNSIEQHHEPFVIVQNNGAMLKFPEVSLKISAAKRIAVLFTLLRTIQETVSAGRVRTIRDVYYSNVELYGDQKKVERGLYYISKNLNLSSREPLCILPAQKGLCYSPFDILVETKGQKSLIVAKTSSMIPYLTRLSTVSIVDCGSLDCKLKVIVLEKEAVYNKLIATNIAEDTVIITGKGYPDFLTRLFLNKLQRNKCLLDWRVYTDADPHGIDIALKYMQNDDHDHYSCRKLVYKGALLTQLLNRKNVQFLEMTQRDLSLAIGLINRFTDSQPNLLRIQIQRQLFFHKKAEMNSLQTSDYTDQQRSSFY